MDKYFKTILIVFGPFFLNFSHIVCAENSTVKNDVKNNSISTEYTDECGPYKNEILTQLQLFNRLTKPCRYDRIQRPESYDSDNNLVPMDVYIRSYVFYMQNLDTQNLQFSLQMRFQLRYNDPRLVFKKVASDRTDAIIGENDLKTNLWIPHVFFVNEKGSGILGTQNKDVLISIHPDGTVIMSSRIQIALYCSMNFRKFPFDRQVCKSSIGSWISNTSQIKLHWENESPFTMGLDKILTEYSLVETILEENEIDASMPGLQYGDFTGNYSTLEFKIVLDRQVGYYLLDYYFPSILIIFISWVSFWLQADQTPPRTMLGVTSMLTFITLSANQTRTLPKVSYIKASEIWSIACVLFIFASLVEFAFVNLLWRRKKHLEIGKITTTNILKKTLTPTLRRKSFCIEENGSELKRSQSDTSINIIEKEKPVQSSFTRSYSNQLSVDTNSTYLPIQSVESPNDIVVVKIPKINENGEFEPIKERQKLTHQQIAIMLDKRARLGFPCAFLVFNLFYWIFVNI